MSDWYPHSRPQRGRAERESDCGLAAEFCVTRSCLCMLCLKAFELKSGLGFRAEGRVALSCPYPSEGCNRPQKGLRTLISNHALPDMSKLRNLLKDMPDMREEAVAYIGELRWRHGPYSDSPVQMENASLLDSRGKLETTHNSHPVSGILEAAQRRD
ncbi:hypothetical protein NDU88_009413 [Pleurodeles waltl]|uniref:Uncharacterized protein n=1 Tax=Pleurodeles waltl TaxID=8319 RepID=A0AAV7S0E6_PLEWA|nr:hypothetical protein NDU88_009413 [Pleurodeles waltl]